MECEANHGNCWTTYLTTNLRRICYRLRVGMNFATFHEHDNSLKARQRISVSSGMPWNVVLAYFQRQIFDFNSGRLSVMEFLALLHYTHTRQIMEALNWCNFTLYLGWMPRMPQKISIFWLRHAYIFHHVPQAIDLWLLFNCHHRQSRIILLSIRISPRIIVPKTMIIINITRDDRSSDSCNPPIMISYINWQSAKERHEDSIISCNDLWCSFFSGHLEQNNNISLIRWLTKQKKTLLFQI